MQYAEVLINQKTKEWNATFSYGIKPEFLAEIKIGSIVEVPFGRQKKIEGVVISLKRSLPRGMKGQIKNIERILQPSTRIFSEEIECAKWMAKRYLSSWSEALFAMLPPIPKKNIELSQTPASDKISSKKMILLCDRDTRRYEIYEKLISKNIAQGKVTVIIFPDFLKLKSFAINHAEFLKSCGTIYYHSDEKMTGRYEKWLKMRNGEAKVVLASRLGLLCRLNNVATVILDEASHSGHQDDQSPRYNSEDLARFWQKKLGFDILLGDLMPTPKQLVEAKLEKLQLFGKKWLKPDCQTKIVDMAKEKSAISLELEKMIGEIMAKNETMVILLPRKGTSELRRCGDCGYKYECPRCENQLIFDGEKNIMSCANCRFELKKIDVCPECSGANIKVGNFGVEKVAGWIRKETNGNYGIINLDRETKLKSLPKAAIYIATQAIFRYPIEPYYSAVIGTDLFLSRPSYSASEEAFYSLFKLSVMTRKKLLIQTEEPELLIFRALATGKYQLFLQNLLKERYENKYPPYGSIVKIQTEDEDEDKAQKKNSKILSVLNNIVSEEKIMGPIQTYPSDGVKKSRYNIIIKVEKGFNIELLRNISNIAKVDINPRNILT